MRERVGLHCAGAGQEMQDQDLIREFVVESHENLSQLDQQLVELEKSPKDAELLAAIFRTFHTIKGTCGFLGFAILEKLTHQAENILAQLRNGERELTPELVSLILETVDATRRALAAIEASGEEGPDTFEKLIERLRATAQNAAVLAAAPAPPRAEAPEPPQAQTPAPPPAPTIADPAPASEHADARPAEVQAHEEESAKSSPAGDANVRVAVGLLDKLMDLVGELVLTRNQILQFNSQGEDAAINATAQRLNLITTELQEGVMKTRMQRIGTVWNKLPRVVRDVALALGKQIKLEMDGAETELDRTIIEAIKDPLVHLVRNACDHGVESPEARAHAGKPLQGLLVLRAYHEGGLVNIEISDDGAGMDAARLKQKALEKGLLSPEQAGRLTDREALNLIFHPGFSTAEKVTNVSGRGVGMDVVKTNIEKIGGTVDVQSAKGVGTTIKIKIPLTLAIIPALVVSSAGHRYAIPQISLLELVRLEGGEISKGIESIHGVPVYRLRGRLLPLVYLDRALGLRREPAASPAAPDGAESVAVSIVVLQADGDQFGLIVDEVHDSEEIVVKPLGRQLKGLTTYAGATIMGDGRVALILDVLGIGQRASVLAEAREQSLAATERKARSGVEQQRLLLFQAGLFERLAVPLSLVARLEAFPRSMVERAGGNLVVQYRDRILPLIPLRTVLETGRAEAIDVPDPVDVIVFNDDERSVGIVVDRILDIVEEAVTVREKSSRKGLLGTAVVSKRVTDFLDLHFVLRASAMEWFEGGAAKSGGDTVLVAEPSAFSRGLLRTELEMAGYEVVEAPGVDEAIARLDERPVRLVLAAVDLPSDGAAALAAALRQRPEWQAIPVLALAASADAARAGFQDCQLKFDHEAVLGSVARLISAAARVDPAPVPQER
jgi:two-component system chemotaxis sensor kinase CheA